MNEEEANRLRLTAAAAVSAATSKHALSPAQMLASKSASKSALKVDSKLVNEATCDDAAKRDQDNDDDDEEDVSSFVRYKRKTIPFGRQIGDMKAAQ
jgi:hypothetical protein